MPFFSCAPHKVSFPTYGALVFHYHTGDHLKNSDQVPKKADSETAELPEGYELHLPKKKKEAAPAVKTVPVPTPPDPDLFVDEETAAPVEGIEQSRSRRPARETVKTASRREAESEEPRGRGRRLPYRELPEPNSILRGILEDYPGMPEDIITEIMSWADSYGIHGMAPMQVQYLLGQMANVPKGAAALIPQKYSIALQNAAQMGQADVLSAMDFWNNGGQGGFGGINPMTGAMPQFARTPMNPMFGMNSFGPFGGGGTGFDRFGKRRRPRFSEDDYDEEEPEPRPRRRARFSDDGGDEPRSDPRYEAIQSQLANVTAQLNELTTKKKEDALNARLDKIEDGLYSLMRTPPSPGAGAGEGPSLVEKLAEQIADLRAEISNTKNSQLEETVEELKQQFVDAKNERLAALQEQVTDLREAIKHPTGRTDMDVVHDISTKALDTVKEAGKDIRAFITKDQTAEKFAPDRVPPERRIKTGQALAATVEKEARLMTAEDMLLSLER